MSKDFLTGFDTSRVRLSAQRRGAGHHDALERHIGATLVKEEVAA
jgi:hypothetical protein